MKTKMLGVLASISLVACGGGGTAGGGVTSTPSSTTPQSAPVQQATTTAPSTLTEDLALATRLYAGDARTPDGFDVEARPEGATGTVSTRHLKNTDFASATTTFEVCTNDMAQAIDWSESMASWGGQYSDMVEVRADARLFEVVRVPRADSTALLRHRVFKCDYLDRAGSDLRADNGAAGAMNQRPLTASELRSLSEYLWQFTMFNNADYAVQSSAATTSGNQLVHTIRQGKLIRGGNGACDTVQLSDWSHHMDASTGAMSRSLTEIRSFRVRNMGGVVESCG